MDGGKQCAHLIKWSCTSTDFNNFLHATLFSLNNFGVEVRKRSHDWIHHSVVSLFMLVC